MAHPDELVDEPPDLLGAVPGQEAVGRQGIVPGLADAGGVGTAQDVGHVAGAVPLVAPHDAREDLLGDDLAVLDGLELAEADVAGSAAGGGGGVLGRLRGGRCRALVGLPLLAEVLDQGPVAADGGDGEGPDVAEPVQGALELLRVRGDALRGRLGCAPLDEALPPVEVRARIEEDALGGEPVPACAAGLLAVLLDALRRLAWMTKRTSGRSMPMPKATVATITSTDSLRNASWALRRSVASRPAWYGRHRMPAPARFLARDSTSLRRRQ